MFICIGLVLMLYPILVLGMGKDYLMDPFLEWGPFVTPTVILVVWSSEIIPGDYYGVWLIATTFYLIWATEIISIIFALLRKKAGRNIAYVLMLLDIICNIIVFHPAIFMDIVILILVVLTLNCQQNGRRFA